MMNHKAEKDLDTPHENEERFRTIFEQGPLGMAIVNHHTFQIEKANERLCQILECPESKLIGRSLFDLTHPDDILEGKRISQQIFEENIPAIQFEKRLVTKSNQNIWVRVTATSVRDNQGKPTYGLGMVEDINKQKQAELALAEERNLLRTLIDTIPDYIYVKDTESRFITGNTAVAKIMGAPTVAGLLGKSDFDFYPKNLAGQYYADEQKIFQSGQPIVGKEEPLVDSAGNNRMILTTKVPLRDDKDNIVGLVGIGKDITDRKRTENEKTSLLDTLLQQGRELRALTTRLAEIQETERQQLAQELHDKIGQNLTALGFNLNFVQTQLTELLPETGPLQTRLADSLAIVEETTDRIRDVMAELRPPMLDDYGLVAALEWYTTQLAARVGLTITVQDETFSSRLPALVENNLFRIAQEALTNAAKHAQATEVTVQIAVDDQFVRLTIIDDGVGFDPAKISEHKGKPSLGLLIMKERALAIDGQCNIESTPNQGTKVEVIVGRVQS